MDTHELRRKAIETAKYYTDLGNKIFNTNMSCPNLTFKVRGRVGGKYSSATHEVKVNMVLFSENVEDYIDRTLPHEVAHAFQRHLYGHYNGYRRVMPHGVEWKRIMRAFGKTPKVTHSYDTTNASQRTVKQAYPYRCSCKEWNLTIIRHRRAQQENTPYRCPKCRTRLVFAGGTGA